MSVIALTGGLALYFACSGSSICTGSRCCRAADAEAFLFLVERGIGAARTLTLALAERQPAALSADAGPRGPCRGRAAVPARRRCRRHRFADAGWAPRHRDRADGLACSRSPRRHVSPAPGRAAASWRRGAGGPWVFVYLSAPDLALTQVLVELVTVVLMMLALHWLPPASPVGAESPSDSAAPDRCGSRPASAPRACVPRDDSTVRFDLRLFPRELGASRWGSERGERHHR